MPIFPTLGLQTHTIHQPRLVHQHKHIQHTIPGTVSTLATELCLQSPNFLLLSMWFHFGLLALAPCKKTHRAPSLLTFSSEGRKVRQTHSDSSTGLSFQHPCGTLCDSPVRIYLALGPYSLSPWYLGSRLHCWRETVLGEVSMATQTFSPAAHVVYPYILKCTFPFDQLLESCSLGMPSTECLGM